MPVTLTLAESSSTTTAASTLTTGTIAASGSVVLLWASCGLASTYLTNVSGLGLTWTHIQDGDANNVTGSLWAGTGTPTTGTITGTWGASVANQVWHVVDVQGSSGIIQSVLTLKGWGQAAMTATLPDPITTGSVTLGAYVSNVGTGNPSTPGTGFTVLDDTYITSPANELLTEYAPQVQAAQIDYSGAKAALIAVELGEGGTPEEHHSGASTATTIATGDGAGAKATNDGATLTVNPTTSGHGSKASHGQAALTITATATGAGRKQWAAGSVAHATTGATGAGRKKATDSSTATVTVTATGKGHMPERDIDVVASPTYTEWAAGLITAHPSIAGGIYQGDGWKPGPATGNPETAGTLVNQVTAGAVWIQE